MNECEGMNYIKAKNKRERMDDRREGPPKMFDGEDILDNIDTIDEVEAKEEFEDTQISHKDSYER